MPHGKNVLSHFTVLCLISRILKYHQIVKAEGSRLLYVQHHFFLFLGCHLYAINTHHSRELRIVVAIRNKLLLITRKHNKPSGVTGMSLLSPLSESPVEEFQYIRVGFFLQIVSLLAKVSRGRLPPSIQGLSSTGAALWFSN